MQHGFVPVASGTPGLRAGDCEYNAEQVVAMRRTAIEHNARVLLLPALCLTGATCGDMFYQNTLLDAAVAALMTVRDAGAEDGLLTFVGLPLPLDGKLYNCMAALHRGVILGIVPERAPSDTRRFAPCDGSRAALYIEGSPAPFGSELLFVCENMPSLAVGVAFSPYETQALAAAGATLIVYPEARPSFVSRYARERAAWITQSGIYHTAALHAGAGPGESLSEGVCAGVGLVIEDGKLLAEAPRFSAALAVSEVDMERLEYGRRRAKAYGTPSPAPPPVRVSFELDTSETELTRVIPGLPFVPEYAPDWAARCEETFLTAAHALAARIRRDGAKRVVIGMSGGLGPTLAALTAANAMSLLERPASDVLAVLTPGFSTGARASANARQVSQLLGFSIREIDIRPPATQFMEMLSGEALSRGDTLSRGDALSCADTLAPAVFENAQARVRTILLYDLADSQGGFVLDTRDMTDAALGLVEDGCARVADFSATGGIPKTLARAMIQYAAKLAGDDGKDPGKSQDKDRNCALRDVLRDVVETPVDMGEGVPGPFELHDFFLYYTARWGFTPGKVLRLARHAFGDKYSEPEIAAALKGFYARFYGRSRAMGPETVRVGTAFVN